LRSIHAAAQFVTRLPEGGVEFRFFDGHEGYYMSLRAIAKQSPRNWGLLRRNERSSQ
jgi:hypothetical protein